MGRVSEPTNRMYKLIEVAAMFPSVNGKPMGVRTTRGEVSRGTLQAVKVGRKMFVTEKALREFLGLDHDDALPATDAC